MKVNRTLLHLTLLVGALFAASVHAQCDDHFTAISHIQGSSDTSPLRGSTVTTRGVVTAVVYPDSKAAGIVLRDLQPAPAGTSDSVFIADAQAASIYQVGQSLQVSGRVDELNKLTSLTDISDIKLCDDHNAGQPAQAVALQLPVANHSEWERLEGQLVQLTQPLIVNGSYQLGRYGQLILADKRLMIANNIMVPGAEAMALNKQQQLHMLVLDDGNYAQNPNPLRVAGRDITAASTIRVGDTLTGVEGVLLQNDKGYFLLPTKTPHYQATNPRPANPQAKPARALRIASFNVLNYFNGALQTPSFPTKRGANSAAELARQQAKTVAALSALDADVIGLLEVENNGYQQRGALASLTSALNKVSKQPYRFIITREQPGNDNIKVALLYRPASVSVEGRAALLLQPPFDKGSRAPLAQSFRHLASDTLVTVSINHFKSKGGCPSDASSKDANQADGQGCWNALRTQAAAALSQWLATQPTGVSTNKQIILGDFNAYRMEDPIRMFEQHNWQYLTTESGLHYSYVYNGRTGALDHALASPALAKQLTQMQHWAINADEPTVLDYNLEYKTPAQQKSLYAPTPYRSSDHDPLLATFEF
jgi:predicted extracellular nuclease